MTTDQKVYRLMKRYADGQGIVHGVGGTFAAALKKPIRTIQGALQRLEKANQIKSIRKGQFVVVELAQP